MGIFDRKTKQPEPPKQPEPKKWIYFVLTEDDYVEGIEADCKRIDLYYDIEERDDGEVRIYFYQEDKDRAHEIMNKPRKKPEPPKQPAQTSSVDALIGNATGRSNGRPVIPDNPLTVATAEAEKHFGAADRVAAAKRGELPPRQPDPDYLKRMGLAGQSDPPTVAPTETENRWAEEKLTEELKEIQAEIEEADALVASTQELAPEGTSEKKQRRKRKSSGRTNQIMTRLTDSELTQFQRRVKKSGLAQGEYLRSVALTGKVVIEEHSVADVALLEELALIRAELGRQGGLLKMVIKPNEGQRQLAPEEWDELIQRVRDLEKMKKRLSDLEVRIQNGNSDPQNEQKRPVR